ncbi:MAG: hypothetical protein ABSG16_19525 [Candidatus Acidiferrum sp.]|jgi:hypothetical protein
MKERIRNTLLSGPFAATAAASFSLLAVLVVAWSLRHALVSPKTPWPPAPVWHGTGVLHSVDGAAYPLYLKLRFARKHEGLTPTSGKSNLIGTAAMCTPEKKRYDLEVTGSIDAWWAQNGKNVILYLRTERDAEPKLYFLLYGSWRGPELVLEDRGTLAGSFNRAGTAPISPPAPPGSAKNSEIILQYGDKNLWEAACPESPENGAR